MEVIGLQLYSIKEAMQESVEETLETVAKMGYEGVEFAGYYDRSASEIKELLTNLNLKVMGSHIPYQLLFSRLDDVIAFEQEIGNEYIICPYAKFETDQEWLTFINQLENVAKTLSEVGLTLVYHNHQHEFDLLNQLPILEVMLTQTTHLKFEIDTYWVSYANEDVEAFLTKYAQRIVLIHLKDMKTEPKESTQLGDGILPIQDFIKAAPQVKALVVEQEAFDLEPLKAVELSCQYLKALRG